MSNVAEFNVIIEKDEEGWYVGTVPEIPGCHTQGKTIKQLLERIKEAIEVCLESDAEVSNVKFIGVQKIEV